MADASFDVVVIGGGKEGLVISNYMALNGMTVGLFEQKHELGGALCSDPQPAPGFIANPHAEIIAFWMSPVNYDFKLEEKGLKFILPEVMMSKVFPDDKCIVVYQALEWSKDMGMPFPRAVRILSKNYNELIPWAWAVNSIFTVFGSIFCLFLSISLGFNLTWIIALFFYFLAMLIILSLEREERTG